MRKNILKEKSFLFAKRIVLCTKFLNAKKEYILSKQLLRSGTAVRALAREAEMAESKRDFTHKMHIALKEANETDYWINLLIETEFLDHKEGISLKFDCLELLKILVTIVKTSKK